MLLRVLFANSVGNGFFEDGYDSGGGVGVVLGADVFGSGVAEVVEDGEVDSVCHRRYDKRAFSFSSAARSSDVSYHALRHLRILSLCQAMNSRDISIGMGRIIR